MIQNSPQHEWIALTDFKDCFRGDAKVEAPRKAQRNILMGVPCVEAQGDRKPIGVN